MMKLLVVYVLQYPVSLFLCALKIDKNIDVIQTP
jgi:hypothetical protein